MTAVIGNRSVARFLAFFIDQLASLAVAILAATAVPGEHSVAKVVLFVVLYTAYFVPCEARWSRTLGKYLQGLVVRKLDGSPCGWTAAWIRFALRLLETNPMLLGGLPVAIAILVTKRRQRIGDLLAGTVVVSAKARTGVAGTSTDDASTQLEAEIDGQVGSAGLAP